MTVRVTVVGQGYVGTSIGSAAHAAGHEVLGIDSNRTLIESLSSIKYKLSYRYEYAQNSEIVIIAVPTPLNSSKLPDTSYIETVCKSLVNIVTPNTLIINESTSFPGTLRNVIAPILGNQMLYASAPERVDPGNENWNIRNTPRIIGALSEEASVQSFNFYKSICNSVLIVSSPEVAEAAKLFENTFRQVNIALVNEFAKITHSLNISTFETLNAAASKPFGFMGFFPSVGVGGHCIPVDPVYLSYKSKLLGVETKIINLANEINSNMPEYIASRIDSDYGVKDKNIQIAGITYKPNVPDIRESPALKLLEILKSKGAKVTWHDPLIKSYKGEKSTPIMSTDIAVICVAHNGVDYSPWLKSNCILIDLTISTDLGFPKYL